MSEVSWIPDGTMIVSDSDAKPSNCGTHKVKVNVFKLNSTMVFFFWNLFFLPRGKRNEPAGGGNVCPRKSATLPVDVVCLSLQIVTL